MLSMVLLAGVGAVAPTFFFAPEGNFALLPLVKPGPGEGLLVASGFGQVVVCDGKKLWRLSPSGQMTEIAPLPASEANRKDVFLAPDATGVWLVSRQSRRLWHWHEGSWEGPVVLGEAVGGVAALGPGELLINTPENPGAPFALVQAQGKILARFGQVEQEQEEPSVTFWRNTFLLASLPSGQVAAAGVFRPVLRLLSKEGKVLWETELPEEVAFRRPKVLSAKGDCCTQAELPVFATSLGFWGEKVFVRVGYGPKLLFLDPKTFSLELGLINAREVQDGQWSGGLAGVGEKLWELKEEGLVVYREEVTRTLSGQVVSQEGGGLPGALVGVEGGLLRLETGLEGRFSLVLPASWQNIALTVEAEGFQSLSLQGPAEELLASPLVLRPRPEICVTVRGSQGEPVRQFTWQVASQLLRSGSVSILGGEKREVHHPEGRDCWKAPWEPPYLVRIRASGYGVWESRLERAGEVLADLQEEARARMQIWDRQGLPVGGAKVFLRLPQEDLGSIQLGSGERSCTSQEDGSCEIGGLLPGEYLLEVNAQESLPFQDKWELKRGENHKEITLEPGMTLAVEVHWPNGRPAQGATVTLNPRVNESCTTDPQGHCKFLAVPPGRYGITATVASGEKAYRKVAVLGEEGTLVVRLTLAPGLKLSGRVRNRDLWAGEELSVELAKKDGVWSAPIQEDGTFVIDGVSPGFGYLWVVADGVELVRKELTLSSQELVEVELPRPILVRGKIFAQGRPCGNCQAVFHGDWDRGLGRQAKVEASGEYLVRLAHPGNYRVVLEHAGRGAPTVRQVLLSTSQTLDLSLDGSTVAGRVVDEAGQPVPWASVALVSLPQYRSLIDVVADEDGRFRLSCPEAGRYELVASNRQATATLQVDVGAAGLEGVELVLPNGEPLRIKLLDGLTGAPVTRGDFLVALAGGPWRKVGFLQGSADGIFQLPAFSQGAHRVVVKSPHYGRATFTVIPAKTPVPLVLGPSSYLEVRVSAHLGPCTLLALDASQQAVGLSSEFPPGPIPLPPGGALFNGIAPGWYRLVLEGCQSSAQVKDVVVEGGTGAIAVF